MWSSAPTRDCRDRRPRRPRAFPPPVAESSEGVVCAAVDHRRRRSRQGEGRAPQTETGGPVHRSQLFCIKKPHYRSSEVYNMLALPIFPGSHPPSIVGANVLNFCVRDGNRWTHIAINTNLFTFGDPYRIRTDVNGVRGRCLNHLTNGPLVHLQGLEPGTH